MRRVPAWLLAALCAVLLLASGSPAAASAPGLDLHDPVFSSQGWAWLTPRARVADVSPARFRDPFEVLVSSKLDWQRRGEQVLNVGFGESAWWIHVPLHNRRAEPVVRILEIAQPIYDDLHVWLLSGDEILAEARMGDRLPFADRPIPYRHPTVRIVVPPQTTVDLLIRAHAYDGEHDPLPIRLWETEALQSAVLLDTLAYGAYFGAVLILLLYNLMIYLSTRERSFLWYAVYLSCFLAWNFTYRGFSFQYLWPGHPDWNSVIIATLVVSIYMSLTKFTWVLLNLRQHTPRLFRVSQVLVVLAPLHVVAILIDRDIGVFSTLDVLGVAILSVLMIAALRMAWRGMVTARIYVAAIGCVYLGTLPYYLEAFGLISPTLLTMHSINIGSALEFVLLALALADRINRLKAEKLAAERAVHLTLQQSARELEEKVRERTDALAQANDALREQAVRDGLTGLYNRRHFNEELQRELALGRRLGKSVALLLIDLDQFKALNDLAGHQAGDEVLIRLGRLLRAFARRDIDQAFRVGGEEFALISLDASPQGVHAWAEELRQRIEDAGWPHPAPGTKRVTASIGAALSTPDDTLESFYARADQALYRAKGEGRNCVSSIVSADVCSSTSSPQSP